ncbi:glucose-6-phosphate isomerase [Nostoc sp. PCC 7107]|uniref:glucose-6-phosphate isomerase n=1 Tax=Nostoc sp. PCC 7107 TaxID=317936 RepID=UPI00029F0DFF|nr:glucose-6-phosphate isomerase [Nostoc sp. PCC 7107]AFY41585.1 glucose-6-phosphate isomerase [Nostoc sp. PCC 7107]
MDAIALWQRYQDWLYFHEGLGLYLDVSRMRFDDAFVESLRPKFDKAFRDMAELEKGAIANPDENRMVGHYWLRNPDLAPTPELTQEIVQTLEQIEAFAEKVQTGAIHPPRANRFTDIISIGIGGSALGPEFVSEALASDFPPLKIHFIDNTDPAGIDRILNQLRNSLASTLVLVISKSGGTPEPRNGMIEVKKAYAGHNLDFAQYAVAITSHGSNLDKIAQSEGWLATFPMYDWVGGRTSEMSTVGLVPAALQGIDIRAMLDGAKEMDDATRIPDIKNNPAALLALSWYYAGDGKGKKDMVVLPYKDSLALFSRYLQQLVMESLGKEQDLDGNIVHQGIAVYGNKGSTDQHAYVQQLRDGVPNFFATLIEVLEDRHGQSPEIDPGVTSGDYLSGFLQGTRKALYENQRDSITITIPQVNARTVGALIALYDRAVGFYGNLVNVNAYHQPGVEAGKKAAAAILDLQTKVVAVLQAEKTPLSLAEIAKKAGAAEEVEAIYKILRHLNVNQRGVVLQGNLGEPGRLKASLS